MQKAHTPQDKSNRELPETFGARVRRWRVALGLSQAELARRASYSRQYVWDIERDRYQGNATARGRIVDALLAAQVAAAAETARYAQLDGGS